MSKSGKTVETQISPIEYGKKISLADRKRERKIPFEDQGVSTNKNEGYSVEKV